MSTKISGLGANARFSSLISPFVLGMNRTGKVGGSDLHWVLLLIWPALAPWETTTNEEARSRGVADLSNRHKLSAWSGRFAVNSGG